jgi:hypothetical protein
MFPEQKFISASSINTHDLSGAAAFFIDSSGYADLKKYVSDQKIPEDVLDYIPGALADIQLDLIITSSQYVGQEVSQLTEFVGDYFNLQFFGREIPLIQFSGKLSMLHGSQDNKKVLMLLYTKLFRLSCVARYNIMPYISFYRECQTTIAGAMLNLNIQRTSDVDDFADVQFKFLVFKHTITQVEDGNPGVDLRYSVTKE